MFGEQLHTFAFITLSVGIQKILNYIGIEPEAPRKKPASGPPLWEGDGAQAMCEVVKAELDRNLANQSPPAYPSDQRTV